MTVMPGLRPVAFNSGSFLDRHGAARQITFEFFPGPVLHLRVDDGTMCQFAPWDDFPRFWSATGIMVTAQGAGVAPAIYAFVRDLLAPWGAMIAPSEKLTENGRTLWRLLDPKIEMEFVEAEGCYRPDLTGLAPPQPPPPPPPPAAV
ncbi:hypothetical protein [Phenylobacterium sp.]|jgi:hypothetical protein|uniref:hypothetical protein n=1 Tax=Phenylobacterium sp. TaxID=1871053 RepID=UPI002E2FED62|nr:hypothetical protein [Phenylobacterium sp.]HEX3364652.1 hypothetical protein [Phenylobacterium sp.]